MKISKVTSIVYVAIFKVEKELIFLRKNPSFVSIPSLHSTLVLVQRLVKTSNLSKSIIEFLSSCFVIVFDDVRFRRTKHLQLDDRKQYGYIC